MANVTQLKHLEHIEDEMLNYGVVGCMAGCCFPRGTGADARQVCQRYWFYAD